IQETMNIRLVFFDKFVWVGRTKQQDKLETVALDMAYLESIFYTIRKNGFQYWYLHIKTLGNIGTILMVPCLLAEDHIRANKKVGMIVYALKHFIDYSFDSFSDSTSLRVNFAKYFLVPINKTAEKTFHGAKEAFFAKTKENEGLLSSDILKT
ncbi:hypothetical protein ACJX0J_030503, partial [Zea mays]